TPVGTGRSTLSSRESRPPSTPTARRPTAAGTAATPTPRPSRSTRDPRPARGPPPSGPPARIMGEGAARRPAAPAPARGPAPNAGGPYVDPAPPARPARRGRGLAAAGRQGQAVPDHARRLPDEGRPGRGRLRRQGQEPARPGLALLHPGRRRG